MIWSLYFLALVIWLVFWRIKNKKLIQLSKQFKSNVTCLPVIGHSYKFIGNEEVQMKAYQEFGREALRLGGITSMWIVNILMVVIADPVIADFCLKNYLEKGFFLDPARQVVGNGSVFAPVPIWRPRRKVLLSAFTPKNIQQYSCVFAKQASKMVNVISVNANKRPFSIWTYFTHYTMDSTVEALLGVKLDCQTNQENHFVKSFDVGTKVIANRMISPWLRSNMLFRLTSAYSELENCKKHMSYFIRDIISSKRKEMAARGKNEEPGSNDNIKTFLELLIEHSETEKGFNDLELQEEMQILVMAGNDTSAIGSSFTTIMLARHPNIQEKVYQELYEIFGDSQRQVTPEDLHQMKYLDAVIKETLRLYPSVPMIVRESDRDLMLPSGVTITKGCVLQFNLWAIHRNTHYWGADAEEFRPERWFEDNTLKHPAQYMTFSHGPRNCLGYQFAMSLMKIALSSLLRRYRVLPPEVEPTISNGQPQFKPIRLEFGIMMKDVDKFIVQIENRV